MNDDIEGDEAMERLNRLTDKLFKVKEEHEVQITEQEPDTTEPDEDE